MDKTSHTNHLRDAQIPIGNIPLRQSLAFVGIARSTAYEYGLVPEYDECGRRKPARRTPPFPWLAMPDSITRSGSCRKLFRAEEIIAWRDAVHDRSHRIDDLALNNCNALVKREGG